MRRSGPHPKSSEPHWPNWRSLGPSIRANVDPGLYIAAHEIAIEPDQLQKVSSLPPELIVVQVGFGWVAGCVGPGSANSEKSIGGVVAGGTRGSGMTGFGKGLFQSYSSTALRSRRFIISLESID